MKGMILINNIIVSMFLIKNRMYIKKESYYTFIIKYQKAKLNK